MNEQKVLLIVEDEEDLRKIVAEDLLKSGYRVYQSANGEEGFRIAREVKPDLIISDVVMPRQDGNQLLKSLKQSEFGKDIPFIVITARKAMRDYFEVSGVEAFFEKPFKLSELTAKIRDILETKERGAVQQKGAPAPKPKSGKGSDISAKEEALVQNAMFDIETKAPQTPTAEPRKDSGQLEGRQRIQKSAEKKVIIYESELFVFKELEAVFAKDNCAAELVLTRGECIEEAQRLRPNLILLKAGAESGYTEELAEAIREMPELRDIPIIIYHDIGTLASGGQKDPAKKCFVWSQEGMQMLKRIRELLGRH